MASTAPTPKLLEKQIDRLYSLPLDEFTQARNELAAGLRASGDRDGADRVRALGKPTLPAWTVNQVARARPRELRALFAAVDAVREAQASALEEGPSSAVRDAAEAERAALGVLADAAGEILAQSNRRPAGLVDRVAATLRAGAVDPESRRLLQEGRLTAELEPAGFGGLAGLAGLAFDPGRAADDRDARERARAARERAEALETEVRGLRAAVLAAEGRARDAEREAERTHREAEDARADLRRAEDELERARAEIR
jgi:hypothetical protein